MKFSLSPTGAHRALPISGIQWLPLKMMRRRWRGGERGEKAATHLTNHPNSFKHKFRTKISHKSDTKRTTVTLLPPRFKSLLELAFDQTTATYYDLELKDSTGQNKVLSRWRYFSIDTRNTLFGGWNLCKGVSLALNRWWGVCRAGVLTHCYTATLLLHSTTQQTGVLTHCSTVQHTALAHFHTMQRTRQASMHTALQQV